MTPRDANLISLGRRPRPTGRAVPLTPATRDEIDRAHERIRIDLLFRQSQLRYLSDQTERITVTDAGCWEWASGGANGYPRVRNVIPGMPTVYLHRLVASAVHGDIPPGWYACHRCDNPPCVNPEHLFIGSPRDNSLDMFAKGRGRPQTERGEKHSRATVDDATVREALSRVDAGESMRSVAHSIGVNPASIRNWRSGITRTPYLARAAERPTR